jgi:F-type H+-transporting ATPase subunit a
MPEHATWFTFLIPHYEERLQAFREVMGVSFLSRTPAELQYVIGFAFVALLILFLVLVVKGRIAKVEKAIVPDERLTLRTFFESMTEGALNLMEGSMNRKAAVYFLPLIGTSAFIIFFSNLIGLVPGFLPPTSNLNTTLAMALVIFLTTHIYGVKEHGLGYLAHFFGPIRKWYALPLMLLMFGIELVSHIARPVSLSIRLMGNMYADHLVVGTFIGLIPGLPLIVPVPVMLLGVIVCIVQTLVFCILSTLYIGMAIAHEEH